MTKGITGKEPDPRIVYADIIGLPHHQSATHPHMSLYDRAAQFSSYKALSGYEDMVAEEARLTDREIELEEHDLEVLNQKLTLISDVIADGASPVLTFTVFIPDESKDGGMYVDMTEKVKKVDVITRKVVLEKKRERSRVNETIDFDRIIDIQGDLVDYIT
ncbi:MAG: hypothetical protein IJV40_15890 [Oscillospiraceae bacterium]|nr:hypothetical protein [Oscillospiraceae bacterium]